MKEHLPALSQMLRERALIDGRIAALIGRPAHSGHIGEFIAAAIFDIALHESASYRGSDGVFTSGVLTGKSVNIKLYSKHAGLLDIINNSDVTAHPDTYLVMVGGRANSLSSKKTTAPLSIESIYLFESIGLHQRLVERGVQVGIATSVRASEWNDAMVYPESRNSTLVLTEEQRALVALFTLPTDLGS